jgi:hypothetical protein
MSTSTDGIAALGFNLGSDEEWLVEEADEDGGLELDWFGEADNDFVDAAERRLLAAAGFTETWSPDNEGYFQREREAKERLGVQFVTYCSGEYPMFILATKAIQVSRGYVEPLNLDEMAARTTPGGEDEQRLRHALGVLGLTPKQESPQWLLCSFWG